MLINAVIMMIFFNLGVSIGFLLLAGLRFRATGFYFVEPAMLSVVLNITNERQKRGMTWESPLSVVEYLRRVYLCVAVLGPILITAQLLLTNFTRV